MTPWRPARLAAGLLAAGALAAPALAQAACGSELPARVRQSIGGDDLRLAFAPRPGPILVGRHFALDVVLCAPPGKPPPLLTGVDAEMPAHRHGMNYRPSIVGQGSGRYTAQGLMFHMPGRWRLVFDVNGRALTHEVDVE